MLMAILSFLTQETRKPDQDPGIPIGLQVPTILLPRIRAGFAAGGNAKRWEPTGRIDPEEGIAEVGELPEQQKPSQVPVGLEPLAWYSFRCVIFSFATAYDVNGPSKVFRGQKQQPLVG